MYLKAFLEHFILAEAYSRHEYKKLTKISLKDFKDNAELSFQTLKGGLIVDYF